VKQMTPCDSVWDLLSLYADGEASPVERDLVERHVDRCESCALDLQFLREAATVLARTPLVSPPPDLKQAILASTVFRPTWQERLRLAFTTTVTPRRLQLAGSVAALAIVGVFLFRELVPSLPGAGSATVFSSPVTPPVAGGPKLSEEAVRSIRSGRPSSAEMPATPKRASDDELVSAEPVSPGPLTRALKPHAAPLITTASPRRQNFRISDETKLATAVPKVVEELALTEPSTTRDASDPAGAGDPLIVRNETGLGPEPAPPIENLGPRRPARLPSYVLTASPGGGAETMGSFANLRAALRKQSSSARAVAFDSGTMDRRLTLDLKSRF
jgi:hypothetical protein